MELREKKVLVAGFGKSGRAAADFLLNRGARVTVCDHNERISIPRELMATRDAYRIGRVFNSNLYLAGHDCAEPRSAAYVAGPD